MAVLSQVEKLVSRLSPIAICDDCITDKLGLGLRQHANQKTRELAGDQRYRRSKDVCGLCLSTKLVISKR